MLVVVVTVVVVVVVVVVGKNASRATTGFSSTSQTNRISIRTSPLKGSVSEKVRSHTPTKIYAIIRYQWFADRRDAKPLGSN